MAILVDGHHLKVRLAEMDAREKGQPFGTEAKLIAHLLVESSREYARLRQQGKQVGEEGKTQAEGLVAPLTPRSRESTS